MIEYLACGNIMSDRIKDADGTLGVWHMGGPAFYALSGMRLWTEHCVLVTRTGADWADSYRQWMLNNGISERAVKVDAEELTKFTLCYDRNDGGFTPQSDFTAEHLGYLKTHPYDIDAACEQKTVRGMYIAQNTDKLFWRRLMEIKQRRGFKVMWEIEYSSRRYARGSLLPKIREVAYAADLWSINHNEASHLFGIPRENTDDIINELSKLPFEMVFYRVGSRGAYVVTGNSSCFCPSIDVFETVDPTGCGNCSTGAAMYAYLSGNSPQMVGIMANLSAAYNIAQYGPYPCYSREDTDRAAQLAKQYEKNYNT